MRHLRILVCRVEDEAPDRLTEVAGFDLPESNPAALNPTVGDALRPSGVLRGAALVRRHITRGAAKLTRISPTVGLKAYPNNPAARKAIRPQAKWSNAR
jgi:hypothetical protein